MSADANAADEPDASGVTIASVASVGAFDDRTACADRAHADTPVRAEHGGTRARVGSDASAAIAAVAAVRTAAHEGDIAAQALYAQMLGEGRGVAHDPVEALYWYTLAASGGHAMAMNMAGRCHELGRGTPVDCARAAAWYRRAAQSGLDWGCYNYATLLRNGRGIARDRALALAFYRRAAALGHAKSMNMLGRYHDEGWEMERDPAAAAEWYRRAAIGGDFRGQTSYASVLALRGELAAAVYWLGIAITTATPAFLARLADDLATSPHAALRAFASRVRARAAEHAAH